MSVLVPVLPETAPFDPQQRAWLNGFFAGLLSAGESSSSASSAAPAPQVEEEDFPWHDSAMLLGDRMKLAEDRPASRKLMAAMAQLDCGSCGYLCQTYAEAIASGSETDLKKCSPGGKETAKKLKEISATLTISATPMVAKESSAVTVSDRATRDNPCPAPLIRSMLLNREGSEKEVRHIEISLKGSTVNYKAGDALGVWPENCLELVEGVLERLNASGAEEAHSIDGMHTSLFEALRRERMLSTPTEQLIELLISTASAKSESEMLQRMLIDEGGEPLEGLHVLDVLELIPSARPQIVDFVNALGKLSPRLYSIASSPVAHAGQVHLTVGAVRYRNRAGRLAKGVASTFLADRVRPGEKVRVFVHESKSFGLPVDTTKPIIMVGPGTGIAPFRSFLHERQATSSKGKNWLFFGDQRQSSDFLYREELESMQSSGTLSRLDTAFSRDSDKKVYVQHRMRENAAELWKWLDSGSHFYICGDAQRMAKDVDDTLRGIVRDEAGISEDSAREYLAKMAKGGRYQRDVY